jgi:radical SAM protein with 4Fe4S-binding SPASM domain
MVDSPYVQHRSISPVLRLPTQGWIDLTYRCNNNCRHCWTRLPAEANIRSKELSFEKIRDIADQARQSGCTHWTLSGGEPMLRPDFPEIFDYLTRRAITYDLNTNGTLITTETARLLSRPGYIMVALYGADAEVHDHITRTPGSFEACLRGMAYLREASVDFTVQLVPLRDNYHQLDEMNRLAKELSPSNRFGATFLYLSADRNPGKNKEIIAQRLTAREEVALDPTRPSLENYIEKPRTGSRSACGQETENRLLEACILKGQQFHVDPYGFMSICSSMKDPSQRFDLNEFSFDDIWDKKLPAAGLNCPGQGEYAENCGSCDYRSLCQWCPAYGYLEKGRLSAPVPHLCKTAKERHRQLEEWNKQNYRVFELAGMTVHVDADIPLKPDTFGKRFDPFIKDSSQGEDHLYISHHFSIPDLSILKEARLVYSRNPWAIYRHGASWIYLAIGRKRIHSRAHAVAVFNQDHTRVRIYHKNENMIRFGNLAALTGFPSDQIMMSRVLADRKGCYLHSSGFILNNQGILFAGRSGAGKSTIVKMLKNYGTVLSDDRNIIRKWPDGHYLHGTWSHGEVPLVSNSKAPVRAILFLEKARKNKIIPLEDKSAILHQLLNRVVRPYCDQDWWDKTVQILATIANEVPAYRFRFTRDKEALLESMKGLVGPLSTQSKIPHHQNDSSHTSKNMDSIIPSKP